MRKNTLIAALVFIALISGVYAFIQQTKAEAAMRRAEQNLVLAMENEKKANMNAAEAKRQEALASQALVLQQQLEDCKKKK